MNVGTFPIVATVDIHFFHLANSSKSTCSVSHECRESDNQTISVQVDLQGEVKRISRIFDI